MKLAVVVGMQSEANIVSQDPAITVIIGKGDPGGLAAELAAAIDGGCDHVLSFGTCGGLNPALTAGEVVVGRNLTAAGESLPCDPDWAASMAGATGGKLVGATVSTATIATAADKAALFASSKADVVDFETLVAAGVAQKRGVAFGMLRAVSDTASQDIPPAALAAMTSTGGIDIAAVIDSLVGDDSQLPALMALADSSSAAFDALAQALADIGVDYSIPA